MMKLLLPPFAVSTGGRAFKVLLLMAFGCLKLQTNLKLGFRWNLVHI